MTLEAFPHLAAGVVRSGGDMAVLDEAVLETLRREIARRQADFNRIGETALALVHPTKGRLLFPQSKEALCLPSLGVLNTACRSFANPLGLQDTHRSTNAALTVAISTIHSSGLQLQE